MKAKRLLSVVCVCLLLASVGKAGEGWETNWENAKVTAAKEGKDILADFTGSDWCGWCIKLDKEVFSQEAFKTYAASSLVLLELDFPRKKELSPELKEQNRKLQQQFGVTGFPTIFLLDAQGRPYARTGYREGGADAYVGYLKELTQIRVKRDEALAKAKEAQGLERAKLLAEALAPVPVTLLGFYGDLTAEIQGLDKANETGFKAKLLAAELVGIENRVRLLARSGKQQEALAAVDAFIADNGVSGELKQKALFAKLNAYPPTSLDNLAAAEALIDQVIALDSTTATAKQCTAVKDRIAQMKQRLAAAPAAPAPAAPAAAK